MSTADNRTCLECKYTSYTANQCFATGLCKKAVEQLQAELAEAKKTIKQLADSAEMYLDFKDSLTSGTLRGRIEQALGGKKGG